MLAGIAKPTPESTRESLIHEIDQLVSMPCIEAILVPLMSYLQQPMEQQDMQRIVDLVSHDSSLMAQCLRMANSPLFGHCQSITSARGAVIALGLQRMRDIVLSCCVLKLMPVESGEQDPRVLWEHMLGCAMVSRKLAKRIGVADPEQMYLAGLLHDIGFVVNLRLIPSEAAEIMRQAKAERCGFTFIEGRMLGITHGETGYLLARKWKLTPVVQDVIKYHHQSSQFAQCGPAIALVNVCDRICRMNGLGYGHEEDLTIDWKQDEQVQALRAEWPVARSLDWERCSLELQSYINEIQKLVTVLFRFE
jgi:putative nucleotidyltransferase with HDIG domain